ncbi:uncharacterized protein [Rutidosis leptorrhynchoides]|uniref:uncharacterized protein n=1 Tax=Rutidosis leptorrhynchoides TaxID=125765 RepID=UPI003A99B6B7
MKILSSNIRGFNQKGKVGWFKSLIVKEKPCVVAVQETKSKGPLEDVTKGVDDAWIEFIWGSAEFAYIQKSVASRSGGMLLIWDTNEFTANQAVEGDYFLAVKGHWKGHSVESAIVNVYGPHDDTKKRKMWSDLDTLLNYGDIAWILCGDFNEVRNQQERKNCEFIDRRANMFNDFIDKAGLWEIPLIGKKFTRFSDDGVKFSKLDRFLVTEKTIRLLGDLSVVALDRRISDHCPLLLRDKVMDFGPKPTRMFDHWLTKDGAEQAIKNSWEKPINSNRPNVKFRKKLKRVKEDLKNWYKGEFEVLEQEICKYKQEADSWERIAEARDLIEAERLEWLNARNKWNDKETAKSNMLRHKARLKWISDGDENSRFFHSMIKRRASKNNI